MRSIRIKISLWLCAIALAGCLPFPAPTVTAPTATLTPLQPATEVSMTPGSTASPSAPAFTASPTETSTPPSLTETPTPEGNSTEAPPARFAVIGDYGLEGKAEKDVADLVKSWNPDFIITVGDNNYPSGSGATIDRNIGQYYHQYIFPYQGDFGAGAVENRFFPTLGNHDWDTPDASPYFSYFTLPGNERYYDFTWGPVQFFALDSDSREPDGVGSSSIQAKWLKDSLARSTSPWKIVYFHHAPYSSALHGPTDWMQWPFKEWGATAVLSGHDHTYERLLEDGLPYFVNGIGGGAIYDFTHVQDGSQLRYNADYGAMLVEASTEQINFKFINRRGEVIDDYAITSPSGQVSGLARPSTPVKTSVPGAPLEQTQALLAPYQGDLASLPDLTRYTLQLTLNYTEHTFTGHARVDTTNTEKTSLDRLYFRLFPNSRKTYGDGSLTVTGVSVDSRQVQTALSESDTVLDVQLPEPLSPAGRAQVDMDFAGVVPEDFGKDGSGYGIYNISLGIMALSGWYPILAVYDERGWNLDPVSSLGDSVYSDMSLYTVDVTAPSGLALATTGMGTDQQILGDETRYRFVSGPARDFTLVASPDLRKISQEIDGIQVNSYYLIDREEGGKAALSTAAGSLHVYNQLFGPYPYTELDVVEAPMKDASGVEYPGIVLIRNDLYRQSNTPDFQFVVAHEVAHQWWYNLVGNNVFQDPWLDEALATYSSGLFFEKVGGEASYDGFMSYLQDGYDKVLSLGLDPPVTQSLSYFESLGQPRAYSGIVYRKGALFFKAARQEIGDAAFFAALQNYFSEERYKIARPAELLDAFNAAAGRPLDDLYQKWLGTP